MVARARLLFVAAAAKAIPRSPSAWVGACTTVGKRCRRFVAQRLAGLNDELRPEHPRTHGDEEVAGLIKGVLRSELTHATDRSVRSVAAATWSPRAVVAPYFALFGLQPHRSKGFKLSTEPFFFEKVRDVMRLYLNPSDKALVPALDENRQVQAPERTQRVLPIGLDMWGAVTHDYYRYGTKTLFAALDVLDGSVFSHSRRRHRHQELAAFLTHLEQQIPAALAVHLVADDHAIHQHLRLKAWLVRHPA
jgi:putative transposase